MGRIRVFQAEAADFVDPTTVYPAAVLPLIPAEELEGSRVRMHHPGAADEPQLFEVSVDPGLELAPHAHDSSEIIVVVDGELRMGNQRLGRGCSVLVEGRTLYSLRAGPEGARFLNFRGAADYTYVDREGFMEQRRSCSDDSP